MQENDKPVLLYATFPAMALAEEVGRSLVDSGLAACVNLLPGMVSIYRWQGAVERAEEAVMIVKTRAGAATAVMDHVRARHPYENPALLVLPIVGGAQPFLDWIVSESRTVSG